MAGRCASSGQWPDRGPDGLEPPVASRADCRGIRGMPRRVVTISWARAQDGGDSFLWKEKRRDEKRAQIMVRKACLAV